MMCSTTGDGMLGREGLGAMKVLVTGGTGYLGRAVVRALTARGHDVIVFARHATAAATAHGATAIDGDVRDRSALERAARGCEAIWTKPLRSIGEPASNSSPRRAAFTWQRSQRSSRMSCMSWDGRSKQRSGAQSRRDRPGAMTSARR